MPIILFYKIEYFVFRLKVFIVYTAVIYVIFFQPHNLFVSSFLYLISSCSFFFQIIRNKCYGHNSFKEDKLR